MNTEQVVTSNDVERFLASQQVAFYTSAKQAAAQAGDKQQYRHCIDCIDNIISRYGVAILQGIDHE
ncbi:hypothetical protein [Pseudomonas petrae]|uniref:Uncharacterized protein n=1 Tax=Pseudomonas petrae TaxID=2912190 RepID=A0ABS9IDB0_9PSED|nr:hypothetical protein [Pseudomonas petrae]MCF7540222.1 hypothetical protein [Pseudomonas petrae]MCF7545692.1 hypothetical protein [Pseudomonas petrae]